MRAEPAWPDRTPGTCNQSECRAPIRWVLWPRTQKRMPVDAEPAGDGDVMVDDAGNARKLGRGQEYTGPLYKSHFATCPAANKFRKER